MGSRKSTGANELRALGMNHFPDANVRRLRNRIIVHHADGHVSNYVLNENRHASIRRVQQNEPNRRHIQRPRQRNNMLRDDIDLQVGRMPHAHVALLNLTADDIGRIQAQLRRKFPVKKKFLFGATIHYNIWELFMTIIMCFVFHFTEPRLTNDMPDYCVDLLQLFWLPSHINSPDFSDAFRSLFNESLMTDMREIHDPIEELAKLFHDMVTLSSPDDSVITECYGTPSISSFDQGLIRLYDNNPGYEQPSPKAIEKVRRRLFTEEVCADDEAKFENLDYVRKNIEKN